MRRISKQGIKAGLRATASKMALAAALLPFAGTGLAHEAPVAPALTGIAAPQDAEMPDVKVITVTRETIDGAVPELVPLRRELARTQLGVSMLMMAEAHGVTMQLTRIEGGDKANFNPLTKEIKIDSRLRADDMLIAAAHELRHAWQHLVHGSGYIEMSSLSPVQSWVLRATIEADALAFSTYFLADRMHTLMLEPTEMDFGQREQAIAQNLLKAFHAKGTLDMDDYRRLALEPAYRYVTHIYEPVMLLGAGLQLGQMEDLLKKAEEHKNAGRHDDHRETVMMLAMHLRHRIPAERFAAYLGNFGGTNFNENAVTTALGTVSAQTVFNDYSRIDGVTLTADGRESLQLPPDGQEISPLAALVIRYNIVAQRVTEAHKETRLPPPAPIIPPAIRAPF